MAYTIGTITARVSSSGNPITASITVLPGEKVLCVMLVPGGATNRAGGALMWGEFTFTQANTTQKAATTPEASAEVWYLINPPPGTKTLTIPNTGALVIAYVVARASPKAGGQATFLNANGANATSTNPTCTVTMGDGNAILFACVGNGATTWAPSARTGTQISDTDAGTYGDGFQYLLVNAVVATQEMGWTFGTSDDWGTVAAAFGEVPPKAFENYYSVRVGDGMATGERIR